MKTLVPLVQQVLEKDEVLEEEQKAETEKSVLRFIGSEIDLEHLQALTSDRKILITKLPSWIAIVLKWLEEVEQQTWLDQLVERRFVQSNSSPCLDSIDEGTSSEREILPQADVEGRPFEAPTEREPWPLLNLSDGSDVEIPDLTAEGSQQHQATPAYVNKPDCTHLEPSLPIP